MKKLLITLILMMSSVAMAAPSDTTVANNISVGQNAVVGGNMNVNGVSYMAGAVMSSALNLNNQNINFISALGNGNINVNASLLMNGNINFNGNDLIDVDEMIRKPPSTDIATTPLYLISQGSLYNATTNLTGSNINFIAATGRHAFVMANYLNCTGDAMSVYYTAPGGLRTQVIFTEGVGWTASVDNNTTATSLAGAIAANPLFTGTTATTNTVYIKAADSKNIISTLVTGDATCATNSNSAGGGFTFTATAPLLSFAGFAGVVNTINPTSTSFVSNVGYSATTFLQAGAASYIEHAGRSRKYSSADGKLNITNQGASGFTSLTLGLETNAFPSLIVDGAGIKFGLGDGTVGGTFTFPNVGLHIFDTNASHDLILQYGSDVAADMTLTLNMAASYSFTLSGNSTINQDVSTTGSPTHAALKLSDTNASNTLAISYGSDVAADKTLQFITTDSRTLTLNGNATLNDWFNQSVKTTDIVTHDGIVITQEDVGATCTLGQLRYDTGGAVDELCYCQATNTWMCAAMTAGPTD